MIRRFETGDEQGVLALIVPIQREEFSIPVTAADQPDLADIRNFYQTGLGDFWVALEDGRIIGTISLKDIGESEGALRKMFVAATHRGPEPGIAAALLRLLLAEAAARGFRRIYLGTTAAFLAAHRFYEKHGFSLINPDDLPATFPRMEVDSRFYTMALG